MDTATHPITSHTPDAIRAVPATQTLTVAAVYHLTEVGRKASLLAGGDGKGVQRLAEGPHPGRTRRLDPAADAHLQALLGSDPQTHGHHTTGWTVPLLLSALATAGWVVHEHTVRRTLKRLGYRWKRPQYVLGRPDPAYAEKKGA